jgi:hypothetical protein
MMIIPRIDLVWVKGKDNWAAHNMARWAVLEPNKEWVSDFPICLKPIIQKDMGVVSSV